MVSSVDRPERIVAPSQRTAQILYYGTFGLFIARSGYCAPWSTFFGSLKLGIITGCSLFTAHFMHRQLRHINERKEWHSFATTLNSWLTSPDRSKTWLLFGVVPWATGAGYLQHKMPLLAGWIAGWIATALVVDWALTNTLRLGAQHLFDEEGVV